MGPAEEMHTAMVNRSIRSIKAELEYLCDASVISPRTLNELLQKLPSQTALHAPLSVGALPSAVTAAAAATSPAAQRASMANLSLNNDAAPPQQPPRQQQQQQQQQQQHYNAYNDQPYQPPPSRTPQPQAQAAPPSYSSPPPPPPAAQWPPLAQATALYAYSSTDAGDLSLQPGDQVSVTEYMNAEWWKGRSARTGQEGIFPRSYVRVTEENQNPNHEKMMPHAQLPQQQQQQAGTNYGNLPLETSGMGAGTGAIPGKVGEFGIKVGKKFGNAAIFGAGSTFGGDLVNAIL